MACEGHSAGDCDHVALEVGPAAEIAYSQLPGEANASKHRDQCAYVPSPHSNSLAQHTPIEALNRATFQYKPGMWGYRKPPSQKGSFSPHKIFEQTCLCSNLVAPSLMFDDGGTARIHPRRAFLAGHIPPSRKRLVNHRLGAVLNCGIGIE